MSRTRQLTHDRNAQPTGSTSHEHTHADEPIPSETRSTFVYPMEQPSLMPEHHLVRDLEDGQVVDSVYEVRGVTRRQKKNGEEFLKLQLGDVSGSLEAVVWEDVDEIAAEATLGAAVRVFGRFSKEERYGSTLTVRRLRAALAEEFEPDQLTEGPPIPYEQMVGDLENLVGTVQNPYLRELLDRLLAAGTETGDRWRAAPAAKTYHQAYRHGLLEHSLSVAQGVSAMASTFPGIDRDVAVTGALLHDIGKIEAYQQTGGAIDLSDAGKLQGEIPLGYFRVRSAMEAIDGFPPDLCQAVGHIILSHHGKLEHGSPVTPCTREATLVHMIDNLGGTLGTFDRIEKSLAEGERWSGYDRALSGSAYFRATRAA